MDGALQDNPALVPAAAAPHFCNVCVIGWKDLEQVELAMVRALL